MDKDWQDALFESWDNSDVVLGRRDSGDTRTDPSPVKAPSHGTRDGESKSRAVKKRKGKGGLVSETGMCTEPSSPRPRTPLDKRPASTRPSVEMFQSLMIDDDDGDGNDNDDNDGNGDSGGDNDDGDDYKRKESRASVGDNSSVNTIDSNDERRLSDKVRKAWRGVTGQRLADPLEQWMVKHSGGTLREVPLRRRYRESSDKQ
ncbi:hypothetical protein F4860DRAFT_344674 [Xylaria cubensis]|nr:hypothetical protein F4860DRAFT_344674 [Xylaria cubensis]